MFKLNIVWILHVACNLLISGQTILRFDGDVNIGILVDLHQRSSSNSKICGDFNAQVIQQIVAAKWAVDIINRRSLHSEPKIGLQIHDTCNNGDLIERHLFDIISTARSPSSGKNVLTSNGPQLLGLLSLGSPTLLPETSGALFAFNVPLISANQGGDDQNPVSDSIIDELVRKYDNVLTTVPDRAGQIRALVEVARYHKLNSVSLISSNHEASKIFVAEATTMGIVVPRILELSSNTNDNDDDDDNGGANEINQGHLVLPKQVQMFVSHAREQEPNIALIVRPDEALAIAEYFQSRGRDFNGIKPKWLVASLGLSGKKLSTWKRFFMGGILIEPHMPELGDFRGHFFTALQDPDHELNHLLEDYKEEMYSCNSRSSNGKPSSSFLLPCDNIPLTELALRFHQDPYVSFVVRGISALTAAFRLVQLDHCSQDVNPSCLHELHGDMHEEILDNLKKLSFTAMMTKEDNEEEEQTPPHHHFTRNGRLVADTQKVYVIDHFQGLTLLGTYLEGEGYNPTKPFKITNTPTVQPTTSVLSGSFSPFINEDESSRSTFGRAIPANTFSRPEENNQISDLELKPIVTYEAFISRTWTVIIISLAVIGIFVTLCMLIYVVKMLCSDTLVGNQVMGIILMCGVLFLFASVIPWVLPPDEMVCSVRHIMHPLLFVLCFAVLLVKSMQLKSLVNLGWGGKIPLTNQLVSLFFMVMVQVVIVIEWYMATKPFGISVSREGYPSCDVSDLRFVLLHLYPCMLVLLAFFYGASVVTFRHNYNEGRLIAFALIFIIPVMIIFLIVHHFSVPENRDLTVSIAILLIAIFLIVVIFLPKMVAIRQESQLAKKRFNYFNSQWPHWTKKNLKQQSWTPQKWFEAYYGASKGNEKNFRRFSDMHPIYTTSSSSYSSSKSKSARKGSSNHNSFFMPRVAKPYATRTQSPIKKPNASKYRYTPRGGGVPAGSSTRKETSGKVFNGMNYFSAASPISYYFYGDPDPKRPSGTGLNTRTTSGRLNNNTANEVGKQIETDKPLPCRCCSKGNQKLAQFDGNVNSVSNYLKHKKPLDKRDVNHSKSLISSSVPSLLEADCYPGTVIITPDNLSYKDENIWTHKYDTKR